MTDFADFDINQTTDRQAFGVWLQKRVFELCEADAHNALALMVPTLAAIAADSSGRDRERLIDNIHVVARDVAIASCIRFGGHFANAAPGFSAEQMGRTTFLAETSAKLAVIARGDVVEAVEFGVDLLAGIVAGGSGGDYNVLVANLQECAKTLSERATDIHNKAVADIVIGETKGNA